MISQIALARAITKCLGKHGYDGANTRQYNVILRASAEIVLAMQSPTVLTTPGMGLDAWLKSDDTGASSLFMAAVLFPAQVSNAHDHQTEKRHPYDPADFGRCHRFLQAVPEAAGRLGEVRAAGGPVWERLIDNWRELATLFEEELPGGKAPRLYQRMKDLGA